MWKFWESVGRHKYMNIYCDCLKILNIGVFRMSKC